MTPDRPWRAWLPWLGLAALPALMVVSLRAQGRLWWCACGGPAPWSGNVWSPHNSQHLTDPYSLSHLLHGMLFYGVVTWAWRRWGLPWRLLAAALVEAAWEVTENTRFVIERYRTATASLDYEGDTVANSLGDLASFGVGFFLARALGLRVSVAVFVVTELVLLVWIRDNLLLNVLMLLYPVDAIREWQSGGR